MKYPSPGFHHSFGLLHNQYFSPQYFALYSLMKSSLCLLKDFFFVHFFFFCNTNSLSKTFCFRLPEQPLLIMHQWLDCHAVPLGNNSQLQKASRKVGEMFESKEGNGKWVTGSSANYTSIVSLVFGIWCLGFSFQEFLKVDLESWRIWRIMLTISKD